MLLREVTRVIVNASHFLHIFFPGIVAFFTSAIKGVAYGEYFNVFMAALWAFHIVSPCCNPAVNCVTLELKLQISSCSTPKRKIYLIPLFEQYPTLEQKLPWIPLGEFPTPVQRCNTLGKQIGIDNLYIKRDDLTGKVYGGNKVRKLEFLLGDVLRNRKKEVLTFGAAGSNHALATAVYARQSGLKSISMLVHQPNAHYVRANLLMSYRIGAELHLIPNRPSFPWQANPPVIYQMIRHRLISGQFPRVIPLGGSSPAGAAGFVNAAFEIKGQILRGEIPEPDLVYVACGSMGTAAGLILGFKAAMCKARVVAIRVNNHSIVNSKRLVNLIRGTNELLSSLDSSFPRINVKEKDLDIRHDFFGRQYALCTEEASKAMAIAEKYGEIKLEGTYTGKAMAGIVEDAKEASLKEKVVLFWNTYNSRDYSEAIRDIDYHRLPPDFHCYFKEDI